MSVPLTASYLLKVTKFLVKISQFEFLVMTKKNILAYKLFLSSNISDFNLFSETPLFPATPFKSWGPVKPPLFENLVHPPPTPPPAERGECTLWICWANQLTGFHMRATLALNKFETTFLLFNESRLVLA